MIISLKLGSAARVMSIFNADDAEMAEDLIVASFNDAKRKVDEFNKNEMSKLTGGIDLPEGMQLPF